MYVGVSRGPPGGEKGAEGKTSRKGEGRQCCQYEKEGKRETVIKEKERHVFLQSSEKNMEMYLLAVLYI